MLPFIWLVILIYTPSLIWSEWNYLMGRVVNEFDYMIDKAQNEHKTGRNKG